MLQRGKKKVTSVCFLLILCIFYLKNKPHIFIKVVNCL